MIRVLIAIGILAAVIAWWLTSAEAEPIECANCDVDGNGVVNAVDINMVRAAYNPFPVTPTPIPTLGPVTCSRSYDGTQSHLTGSGWPAEYNGAEVHWRGGFGEAFSTLTVDGSGNASASITGNATFAGVVGIDGQPYVCMG